MNPLATTFQKIIFWYELNIGNIIGIIKIFSWFLLIPIYLHFPKVYRTFYLTKFDTEIQGIIREITPIKAIKESYEGGKVYTKAYQIDYDFLVNDSTYQKKELVNRSTLWLKERVKFDKLVVGDSILIRFDAYNPTQSVLGNQ